MRVGVLLLEMLLTINTVKISIVLLKKKKKGCAPRVTSIFHFTEVIVNGFTSPSAPLLWTLFMGFTSLPITRCTDFFTHISKRCLWLELVRTVLLQRQSQTYCCGYPCRRISRDWHMGAVSIRDSAWSSSANPPVQVQGRGWIDASVTRVLSFSEWPESCSVALWSGEHQKMMCARTRVRAQPGYWEETHREALGRSWGHLLSSIERSPPLWASSSPAEE